MLRWYHDRGWLRLDSDEDRRVVRRLPLRGDIAPLALACLLSNELLVP
jgi:hypothetical protein